MSHYPPPSHAVTIWVGANDTLCVTFPPQPGRDRGHTITVPCTAESLGWLAKTLKQRESDKAISQQGCPTQIQAEALATTLDRLLAEDKAKRKAKAAADRAERARPLTLEDLGL